MLTEIPEEKKKIPPKIILKENVLEKSETKFWTLNSEEKDSETLIFLQNFEQKKKKTILKCVLGVPDHTGTLQK